MKKISTIIGVGMISMAVALAPAFAQMTKSPEPPSSTATSVQPKTDEKAPASAPAAKDVKGLPAKPGTDTKSQNVPAKPVTDTKASTVPAKPGTDVKSDTKAMPAKPLIDTKSQNVPAKSGADMKAGAVKGKTEMGAKDEKAATVKQGAGVKAKAKAKHKAVKSTDKVAHPAKDTVKAGSSTDPKSQGEKSMDADSKTGSSNPTKSSTGK